MKSMCHDARRNSPSVADCRPTSSCMRDDVADRVVLDRAQLGGVDAVPAAKSVARLQELGRAEQAADVVGAERRLIELHVTSPQRIVLIVQSQSPLAGVSFTLAAVSIACPKNFDDALVRAAAAYNSATQSPRCSRTAR